ncbi:MAG: host attachment protein [Stellaceae bacterium]
MIKQARWVVIADAGRARVFELDAKGALVRTPIREMEAETAPSRELGSDRPGRTFDSAGQGRHAEEPPTDPHRYEKRRFADELAGFLEDARKQDLVGQLFIVAPPQMLGDLREEFSGELKKFVKAELPKDFSMLPPHQLEQHLNEILGRS